MVELWGPYKCRKQLGNQGDFTLVVGVISPKLYLVFGPTLQHQKMDGWSRWSFLLGFGQFSGANVLLVSGRETKQLLHLYFFETTEGMTWNGWASPFLYMNTEEHADSQVPWVRILQRRVWTWPIDSLVWVTLVFQLKTPPRSSTKNGTDPGRTLSKLLTWE